MRPEISRAGATKQDAWRPITEFALSLVDDPKAWQPTAGGAIFVRDLQLKNASQGRLSARHLRTIDPATVIEEPLAGAHFHMLFVLGGNLTLTDKAEGGVLALGARDCVHMPRLAEKFRFELGAHSNVVELVVPKKPYLAPDKETLSFDLESASNAATPVVNYEKDESYLRGSGPRSYFLYRDLGVAAVTDRRVHIHIVRATQSMPGGTGWHSHTMCQSFPRTILCGKCVFLPTMTPSRCKRRNEAAARVRGVVATSRK